MSNPVVLKRSAVPAKVPTTSDLALGEIGINTYDGKLYIKKDSGTPTIIEVGAASSYVHPATHPPEIISQNLYNRFVTDTEKSTWNAKQNVLSNYDIINLVKEVDGASSGLDADTLDGYHHTTFTKLTDFQYVGAASGYQKFHSGITIQWGTKTSNATVGTPEFITFPAAFSAAPYTVLGTPLSSIVGYTSFAAAGTTGVNMRCSLASVSVYWLAIGTV